MIFVSLGPGRTLRYRRAGGLAVRSGVDMDVWIDGGRAWGTDRETALPCDAR